MQESCQKNNVYLLFFKTFYFTRSLYISRKCNDSAVFFEGAQRSIQSSDKHLRWIVLRKSKAVKILAKYTPRYYYEIRKIAYLTHFQPLFHFYIPWKQKTSGFLMFSEGIEVEYWLKNG